jgi:hypothetical protein
VLGSGCWAAGPAGRAVVGVNRSCFAAGGWTLVRVVVGAAGVRGVAAAERGRAPSGCAAAPGRADRCNVGGPGRPDRAAESAKVPPDKDAGVSSRCVDEVEGAVDGGVEAGREERVEDGTARMARRPASRAARSCAGVRVSWGEKS